MNELLGQLRDPIYKDYTIYLLRMMSGKNEYQRLFMFMNQYPYYWDPSLPRDADRSNDGLYLRLDFMDLAGIEVDIEKYVRTRECSVLEMLIALARRIDNEYLQDYRKNPGDVIFWEFLENLGLMQYTNDNYCINDICYKIEKWLDRRFTRNGIGSPFPVRNPRSNLKYTEYWNIISQYISQRNS